MAPTYQLPLVRRLAVLAAAIATAACTSSPRPTGGTQGEGASPSAVASTSAAATAGAEGAATPSAASPVAVTATGGDARANELGMVPVLEYHHFGTTEGRWVRTWDNFRKDLEFLYANGYVTVNARDLVDRKLDVPAGKKPVVLTFDDANPEQFVGQQQGGKPVHDAHGRAVPTPDCAVGIMDAFAKDHPGFGTAATFYVLPDGFGDDDAKLQYLANTGREVGNHTTHHEDLNTLSVPAIQKTLAGCQKAIHRALPGYDVATMAFPHGLVPPSAEGRAACTSGSFGGESYHFRGKFAVGANPSFSPFSVKFDVRYVPRIQAIDASSLKGREKRDDQWKMWFNRVGNATGKVTENFPPYVSDGDPNKVTVPAKVAKYVDRAALGNRQLVTVGAKVGAATRPITLALAVPARAAAAKAPVNPVGHAAAAAEIPGYGLPLLPGGKWDGVHLTHTIQPGQSLGFIAAKYLKFTDDYTYDELVADLRKANNLYGRDLKIGETLTIPHARSAPPHPRTISEPYTFDAKGVYVTSSSAAGPRVFELVDQIKKVGGNTVVIDAKDMNGIVTYHHSHVPLVNQLNLNQNALIADLPKLIDKLHQRGMHVVMREALFNDTLLAHKMADWVVRSKRTGRPWADPMGIVQWVDPSLTAVQDYEIALAKELAGMGADEIQFDYVRFPAMGDTRDCKYHFDQDHVPHYQIIANFLDRAYRELHPLGVLVSADVYGVVAWSQPIDVKITGQQLSELAKHLDAISPMLYPSHFYKDFDHFAYPPDHPYYFVHKGVTQVAQKIAGARCVIRPWIQAFSFRIRNYGPAYVNVQLVGAKDGNAVGWLLWNADNKYDVGVRGVQQFLKGVSVAKI